jgi:hypothetical protein
VAVDAKRRPHAPTRGPSGGVADTLDEAKAAFRAALTDARKSGREMLSLSLSRSLSI